VKFGDGHTPVKVDAIDSSVIALKTLDATLQAQVEKLETQISKLDEESRRQLKISHAAARQTLLRKRSVEACLQSRRNAHDNIIRTLLAIQMSQVNAEVISAVKESSSALKQEQQKVSIDDVEDLLEDVREMISDINSISETVSNVESENTAEDEELIKELEMLQLQDELEKATPNYIATTLTTTSTTTTKTPNDDHVKPQQNQTRQLVLES